MSWWRIILIWCLRFLWLFIQYQIMWYLIIGLIWWRKIIICFLNILLLIFIYSEITWTLRTKWMMWSRYSIMSGTVLPFYIILQFLSFIYCRSCSCSLFFIFLIIWGLFWRRRRWLINIPRFWGKIWISELTFADDVVFTVL